MRAPTSIGAGPAHAEWQALGTGVVLRTVEHDGLEAARQAVEAELAAIDLACSRFRDDSELAQLNACAGRSVRVGPLLLEALEVALRAAQLSDGDVDPTLGRALELAGYDRDWRLLAPAGGQPAPRPPILARVRAGWRTVQVDRASGTVRLPSGIRLDLGASAKAWAADRAAAAAFRAVRCGLLVGVGGDIATCGTPPAGGWRIHVTDDHRSAPSAPGQTVSIRSGGLATSSTAVRRWSHRGHTMHHIIDPATEMPVLESWRTVSVAAASCTDANIASTAAIVRAGDAPAWLAGLGLPARLVGWDGSVTYLSNWPAQESRGTRVARLEGVHEPSRARRRDHGSPLAS
jgi:FAD:protein FMN transferase